MPAPSPFTRGTLIYDADCGFCTITAQKLSSSGAVDIQPWQTVASLEALGLTEDDVSSAAYWVSENRVLAGGAGAISMALRAHGGWAATAAGRIINLPGMRSVASIVYQVVSRNRHRMPGGTQACRLVPKSSAPR